MKPQGTFRPESIEQLYAAYAEKHGSEMGYDVEAQSFAEAYDYMTCERPDGSKYGTGGQCRKGKETTPGSEDKPKKAATPKQIASAEAKLEKLEAKLKQANEKESEYESAVRGAGYGVARGVAQARAQAGPRRMAEKWRNKAMELEGQVREQKRLVNEMKGIKEAPKPAPAPAPAAPKTPADVRRDKLRKLESSINERAKAIIGKHGKDSPQFQKFFGKYAPKLEKVQSELRNTMFGEDFAEAYDYMTCQRPDGSTYGTSGQCRKGKEVSPEDLGVKPPKGGVGPMSSSALAEVKEAAKSEAYSWGDNHDKLFDKVYAKAETTAHLGKIHKAVMKAVDEGDIDAKEGTLKIIKKAMEDRLKTEMRSGQGAKREAELAKMTPEERRRARTEEAIKRGIKNKVVRAR